MKVDCGKPMSADEGWVEELNYGGDTIVRREGNSLEMHAILFSESATQFTSSQLSWRTLCIPPPTSGFSMLASRCPETS